MEGRQFYIDVLKKDALESIREVVDEITSAKKDDFEKRKLSPATRRNFGYLTHLFLAYRDNEFREVIGDQLSQHHVAKICSEYLAALTDQGRDSPMAGYDAESVMLIRMICVNYSDASSEFTMKLSRVGIFPSLIAELEAFKNQVHDNQIRNGIIDLNLSILHNCAIAPVNKKWVRHGNVVDAIYPYTKVECKEVKMVAILALALIIGDKTDHEKIYADNHITAFILESLKLAIDDEKHETGGYSAREIMWGVKNLVLNDDNKRKMVQFGILESIKKLLEKGDKLEKEVCTATIMALAFAKENKEKIRSQSELMAMLEKLVNDEGETGKNAHGIFHLLQIGGQGISNSKTERESKTDSNSQLIQINNYTIINSPVRETEHISERGERTVSAQPVAANASTAHAQTEQQKPTKHGHILISYAHQGGRKLAERLADELRKRNYKIWIDQQDMKGNMAETLGQAIEKSDVVLMCMSQRYQESKWCRLEAEYAFSLCKPIIPIKVESDYTPTGWLGFLQALEFYVDFSGDTQFEYAFEQLLKELRKLQQ